MISSVALSGFPVGAVVSSTASGGASIDLTAGIYTITGTPAAIRATLDSFAVTPPPNSDVDFSVNVAVTATDTGGVTATRTTTLPITVNPVSDTPVLAAPAASGEEDTFILFGDKATWTKPDADGSERISRVEVTGFGAATAQYTAMGGASVTAIAGGFANHRPSEARSAPRSTPSPCGRPPTPTPT